MRCDANANEMIALAQCLNPIRNMKACSTKREDYKIPRKKNRDTQNEKRIIENPNSTTLKSVGV